MSASTKNDAIVLDMEQQEHSINKQVVSAVEESGIGGCILENNRSTRRVSQTSDVASYAWVQPGYDRPLVNAMLPLLRSLRVSGLYFRTNKSPLYVNDDTTNVNNSHQDINNGSKIRRLSFTSRRIMTVDSLDSNSHINQQQQGTRSRNPAERYWFFYSTLVIIILWINAIRLLTMFHTTVLDLCSILYIVHVESLKCRSKVILY